MATMHTNYHDLEMITVVHPLDDAPEIKRSTEGLAPMEMTRSVKVSLMVLRAYLTTMTLMLIYHVLDLAGIFGK
jgi:hypothetical protein